MEQEARMDFEYLLVTRGYQFNLRIFEHVFRRVQLRLPATLSILSPTELSKVLRDSVQTAIRVIPQK